jgi:diguanylate cyclase (GGDEF)-like protein
MFNKGRNLVRRQYVRLKRWLTLGSIGIVPRLIIAFASVGALAAVANLIVENGVAILEQQRNAALERNAADSQAISSLRDSMDRARRVVISAELLNSLGEFDRSVHDHATVDSTESRARYANARIAMDRALSRHLGDSGIPVTHAFPKTFAEHKAGAELLLSARRERRELLEKYSGVLASLELRVRTATEQSWKVLGRRQPLAELRADLETLKAAFAEPDAFASGALARAERSLTETLRNRAGALRRSPGPDFLAAVEGASRTLAATREAFAGVERRRLAAADTFARESRRLRTLLPAQFDEGPAQAASVASVAAPAAVPEIFAPPSGSIVAWMSAAVLAVLLYVCFATIFSIVRPVRRLIAATKRLARGENARVVVHGGIRELDVLGVAFNSMAEQLAAARAAAHGALQELEAKVEERTRQLQTLAEQDPLTGIANRRQLFVALNDCLERARAAGNRLGLFILDIDNFKTLNDSLGHPFGDRVLVEIAGRLEAVVGSQGFAARLGGDEFTVVLTGSATTEEIVAFGSRIVRAFEKPLGVDDREIIVSVSIGASVFPEHEQDAEELLRAADAALFRAKALGRSQVALFTPELLDDASEKFAIEQRLRRAIQNDEFELFYQPLIDTETLDVTCVEALIRWRTPEGGFLAPADFLDVAEESGLIVEISDWVLRTAIRTAARWHRGEWPGARVAINVSPRQFLDYRFVSRLEELLREHDLPARCLELELTESLLQTGAQTIRTLDQLRAIGVSIALDDFGTGYSSLASLQKLPLTRVKLDRSLIAGVDDSTRSASIARATIALCRGLGLEVTAEGVERLEQFANLMSYRAITLQGYLLARPVTARDVPSVLASLPAHCRELDELTRRQPERPGERRRGALALVAD